MKSIKMQKNNIACNLAALRQLNKFSQEEVAERIGVSWQAVAKWENGPISTRHSELRRAGKAVRCGTRRPNPLRPRADWRKHTAQGQAHLRNRPRG